MKTSSMEKIKYVNMHYSDPSLRKEIGSWEKKLKVCKSELCGVSNSDRWLGNWFWKFPDGTQQTWQAVEAEIGEEIDVSHESESVDTSAWLLFFFPEFWALTLLCSKIMLVNLLPFSALLILICSWSLLCGGRVGCRARWTGIQI